VLSSHFEFLLYSPGIIELSTGEVCYKTIALSQNSHYGSLLTTLEFVDFCSRYNNIIGGLHVMITCCDLQQMLKKESQTNAQID